MRVSKKVGLLAAAGAAALCLGGCVVPPGYPVAYEAYDPGPIPDNAPLAYATTYGHFDYATPSFTYVGGQPTAWVTGYPYPIVRERGDWGWWGPGRSWHHAPAGWRARLDGRWR